MATGPRDVRRANCQDVQKENGCIEVLREVEHEAFERQGQR